MEQNDKNAEDAMVEQQENTADSLEQTVEVETEASNATASEKSGTEKKDSCHKGVLRPLFCFIVLATLAGTSGYSLYLSHKCMTDLNARPVVTDYSQTVDELKNASDRQSVDLKKLEKASTKAEQTVTQANGRLDNLTRAYETMGVGLAELSRKINGRANEVAVWKIAEARFLTRMADRKLRIDHDYSTSADLLEEADKLVLSLNDNRAYNLRSIYAREITKLRSTPAFDYEGAGLRLMAMADESADIRLKMQAGSLLNEKPAEVSDNIADWKQNLSASVRDFTSKFIVVRSKNETEGMLVHPENQLYLRENLRVLLTSAALAGYRGDYKFFQKNREEALLLLDKYFDTTDAKTVALVAMLREIEIPEPSATSPDKSYLESVHAVDEFLNDITGTGSAN